MTTPGHDPSLEFPGVDAESSDAHDEVDTRASRTDFKLVIVQSPVIPPKRHIADISAHREVSIGRDIPSVPGASRLRLKEMAVSKYHAVIYWDPERKEWGLVDVGSVHGTFVQSQGSSTFQRLSPARSASHPRYLGHLDVIKVGGTTMVCHLHREDDDSCNVCILSASNGLALVHDHKPTKPTLVGTSTTQSYTPDEPPDAKTAISNLKTRLLQQRHQRPKGQETNTYVDRAASRRMHLGISDPPKNTPNPEPSTHRTPRKRSLYERASQSDQSPAGQQKVANPEPISVSNIGHRLLSKQGWEPGTGLGLDKSGLQEQPIPKPMANRAGLGSATGE